MDISGKNVAVLGAGTSGLSAARLAASLGASVTVYDSGDPDKLKSAVTRFSEFGISLIVGKEALIAPSGLDFTVLSPGIRKDRAIACSFAENGNQLISEIEFAWLLSSQVPVVGITGTNGKTTTTGLLADILNYSGLSTIPCGNYGLAYSEAVRSNTKLDVMTVELSSFQLETIDTFRPTVSIWMNFAPDHMDWYSSIDEYRIAKERIFENQIESDWCIIRKEEEREVPGQLLTFSAYMNDADFWYDDGIIKGPDSKCILDYRDTGLHGLHNAENVMAAVAAAHCLGVNFDEMIPPIMQYRAPSHRSEIVGVKNGVTFVNDSKATNLHALESSLRGQESAVVLIAGGKKKGLDFSELNDLLKASVKEVVCIGEIASDIENAWSKIVPCHRAKDLKEAIDISYSLCGNGDTVLFSPGTSSFDMFSGYEERGDVFRNTVSNLAM